MADVTATWNPPEPGHVAPVGDPSVILVGSVHEPDRVGEIAFLPETGDDPVVIGRHGTIRWSQHRPGVSAPTGPLGDPQLSREQLSIERRSGEHVARNLGRLPLTLNGQPVTECPLRNGDLLQLGDRVLLMIGPRPRELPGTVERGHRFGEPDPLGWVGEGPMSWWLRDRVRFVARRQAHVLVLGASGSGKELAARGLHALSARSRTAMVSRSAATIPESLADAELFGNLQNYPNPGMAARPGLVGEADGGTLFLDEFGELPIELQARLLRVLDAGEYTPLGEARPRKADLRLIAATNRDPSELKHDVLARLQIRLDVPGLDERREDIPQLAMHLLRRIAHDDAELSERFFDGATPRVSMPLLATLLTHPYATHVRELEALLWQAIGSAPGSVLDVPATGFAVPRAAPSRQAAGPTDPAQLDRETVQAVLDRHGGRQEPAWRELGLASRHVLARLVKKFDLKVRGRGGS